MKIEKYFILILGIFGTYFLLKGFPLVACFVSFFIGLGADFYLHGERNRDSDNTDTS